MSLPIGTRVRLDPEAFGIANFQMLVVDTDPATHTIVCAGYLHGEPVETKWISVLEVDVVRYPR